MRDSRMMVSIIIVSYNTKDLLRNCLKSIYETQMDMDIEIIVVDNASSDGSPEIIENEFKSVRLIKNAENNRYSKANNQGIRLAKGEYLLLLNSDTILTKGLISSLYEFMEEHPQAVAVGPKVLNEDGTLQSKGFHFPSITRLILGLSGLNSILSPKLKKVLFPRFFWDEDDMKKVDWISGCCLFIRKKYIEDIGYLSEDFFLYSEDVEWCYRFKKANLDVWYAPTARLYHINRSSPFSKRNEQIIRSEKLFYEKTTGILTGITISALSLLALLINIGINFIGRNKTRRQALVNAYHDEMLRFKIFLGWN
jgi:GT2 family glycosyltransferase